MCVYPSKVFQVRALLFIEQIECNQDWMGMRSVCDLAASKWSASKDQTNRVHPSNSMII